MDASTPQGSKLKTKQKKEKTHTIPCKMVQIQIIGNKIIIGVVKPGDLVGAPRRFIEPSRMNEKQLVLTYLERREVWDTDYFNVKRLPQHPNILRIETAHIVEERNKKYVEMLIEPYTGTLREYITDMAVKKLKDHRTLKAQSISANEVAILQHIGRSLMDALDHLKANRCYHGNLSMETVYYQNGKAVSNLYTKNHHPRVYMDTHEMIVKLGNFKSTGDDDNFEQAQLKDWIQLGNIFVEIASCLTEAVPSPPLPICQKMNELGKFLQSTSKETLKNIKEEAYQFYFFWDKKRRVNYFTGEVALKLSDPVYQVAIRNGNINSKICTLPWDKNNYDGLKPHVEAYRDKEELNAYNGNDVFDFVRFISAAYTHRFMIQTQMAMYGDDVDGIIQRNHPDLCSALKNLN